MGKCAVKACKNVSHTQHKSDGITFHKVPKDLERRIKWTKIIRLLRKETDWIPTKTTVICSKHFNAKDKIGPKRDGGHVRLSEEAVPMLDEEEETELESVGGEGMEMVWIDDLEDDEEIEEIIGTKKPKRKGKKNENENEMQQKNNRSITKSKNLLTVIEELKKKRLLSEEEEMQLNINDVTVQLMREFGETSEIKRNFRKFPYVLKKFASTLNFYSPAAYEYVRSAFGNSLPHPRKLCESYGKINGDPGFTLEAFNALKERSDNSKSKILCNLVIDEMAIHPQKMYHGKTHQGYVDFGLNGNSSGQNLASSALVLLLVCLNETWKIPIGYFCTHGLTAAQLANIINIALTKCADINVEVASVTCDGTQTNIAAMRILGCKLNDPDNLKTTFKHPATGHDVALLLDPRHMLQLVRNAFASKKVFFTKKGEVHWKYVKRLQKIQETKGFKTGNKVTNHHIYFRSQIMQVELASQVLSNNVAQSLYKAKGLSSEFENCDPTAEFVKLHNDVFNALNSKGDSKTNGFKKTLNPATKRDIFDLVKKYKDYIKNLKAQIVLKTMVKRKGQLYKLIIKKNVKNVLDCTFKTGFMGLLICLESLKNLYARLVGTGVLKYIATYRLSQDHLEMFFNCIRQKDDNDNNPNAVQFKTAYKILLKHMELKNYSTKNYISVEKINTLSESKTDHVNEINKSFDRRDNCDFNNMNPRDGLHKTTKQIEDLEKMWMEQQTMNSLIPNITDYVVGYISGYVADSVAHELKCETCINALISTELQWYHKIISSKDKGLCYPSQNVYDICMVCENVIRHATALSINKSLARKFSLMRLATMTLRELQSKNLIKQFAIHPGECLSSVEIDHSLLLINAIIHKYIQMRLHLEYKLDALQVYKKEFTINLLKSKVAEFVIIN